MKPESLAEPFDRELMRVRLLLAAMVAALLLLGSALWRVQVVDAPKHRRSVERQSMRRVRLPAARGVLADRNGMRLAENKPSYCVAIYVEELRQRGRASNTVNRVEQVIEHLAGALGLKRQVSREDIVRHIRRRCPLPLLVWQDVDEVALARWAERGAAGGEPTFPGVDVYVEPVRAYPQGALAAHVLGYVGRQDPDPDEPYHFYLPEMEGKAGVERALNARLAGVAGGMLLRVDAAGFKRGQAAEREPVGGEDVRLTMDARMQTFAEEALAGVKGAAVVLDPRNGDVLALASAPSFDPRDIRSPEAFGRLSASPDKPLFNRAVSGLYPPGSTFKPLVALAALESARAGARTTFHCPGFFDLSGQRFDCWLASGHGALALREGLEQSCNAYFCQLGLACGYERIVRMADAAGFGQCLGIELPGEAAGLVPDDEWKRRAQGDGWRSGDTCNLSIGQGALLVTPLQMAVFAAALANGGYLFRPRLVLADPEGPAAAFAAGELLGRLRWRPENLAVVRGGMCDVVQAEAGTGRRARLAGVEIAGKTGSAEYGPSGARKKYGWMIAWAPFERPHYAVAMVVEDAETGGITTAPRMRVLLERIFALQPEERPTAAGRERLEPLG